jgi:hypothetical protein
MLTQDCGFRFGNLDLDPKKDTHSWPDWKNNLGNWYHSERMLGSLFEKMTNKIETLGTTISSLLLLQEQESAAEKTPVVDIKEYISINVRMGNLGELEALAKTAAEQYTESRELTLSALREQAQATETIYPEFSKWQEHYCHGARTRLSEHMSGNSLKCNSAMVDSASCLLAAIVYQQCRLLEQCDPNSRACEFAWAAFENELRFVFSGKDVTIASQPVLHRLMSG